MNIINHRKQIEKYQFDEFHDGCFNGIHCLPSRTVWIWCVKNTEEAVFFIVPSVTNLTLIGFTGGDTILDITLYEPQICPLLLFAKVNKLEGEYWQKTLMERFGQFTKTNVGFLLEITTSTGCELLLLSTARPDSVEIKPHKTT